MIKDNFIPPIFKAHRYAIYRKKEGKFSLNIFSSSGNIFHNISQLYDNNFPSLSSSIFRIFSDYTSLPYCWDLLPVFSPSI